MVFHPRLHVAVPARGISGVLGLRPVRHSAGSSRHERHRVALRDRRGRHGSRGGRRGGHLFQEGHCLHVLWHLLLYFVDGPAELRDRQLRANLGNHQRRELGDAHSPGCPLPGDAAGQRQEGPPVRQRVQSRQAGDGRAEGLLGDLERNPLAEVAPPGQVPYRDRRVSQRDRHPHDNGLLRVQPVLGVGHRPAALRCGHDVHCDRANALQAAGAREGV
mmetsp:Transcript_58336/g.131394  ORF Transcript_58336/g.131394 Transcript_58336/m.131394 type:complete len:218 (-) Transcript_58336:585-1238(-)